MNSIYHILDKHPAIYQEQIQIEYENLAQELVDSGRLRIDTDYYCNFIHFNNPNDGINVVFSYAELTQPSLIPVTRESLKHLYTIQNKQISDEKLSSTMMHLNKQVGKLLLISDELTMQLARIFVQSAHPIVIKWMLRDKVEVFITYSHSIGDVMNIQNWKRAGTNSGMQSTDGSNVCIYVSCGGDPFAKNHDITPTNGNGWAAVARLQIIAGQEIGHYADIKRDHKGNQITRHSANFSCTKATPHVKEGRKNDIARCSKLLNKLLKNGMSKLIKLEQKLKFYDKQKLSGLHVWWIKLFIQKYRRELLLFAHQHKLHFIKRFKREKYMGLMIAAMIEDMQSHLSPIADVYKRNNPNEEEAISCVEALARVPQQVMKWGYLTTRATMHDLYKVYYSEVIPSLIENYNHLTITNYKRNYSVPKQSPLNKILTKLGLTRRKNKFKFTEIRDV
jgi:hypothetical protein